MKTSRGQLKGYEELPYRQLFIIGVSRFAEPVCFTVLFPFIVSMVRDFHIAKNEQQVGYYVGLITSSFALAQLATGIHWGMLSDRIGRRPVILFGLLGTITSILLFGLSKSYMWALVSRSSCGLLNGNIGALKSMVSELTTNASPADRARAFSLLPLVYGLGGILGPILGGFLSHPVSKYPSLFGDLGFVTDILTEFPYFLPCLISASICAFGWVIGFFYLEETLVSKIQRTESEEERALLADQPGNDYHATNGRDLTCSRPPTLRESLTPPVLAICLCYGSFAYQAIYYEELFPIWTASSREAGGLGFTPNQIGTALAFTGGVTLFAQLVLLPRLTEKFGLVQLYKSVLFMMIFVYASQGFVRYLYDESNNGPTLAVWAGLLTFLAAKTVLHTIVFTGSTVLVNNATSRPDALGAVNGFAQSCASGMRALGPATCGIIWSTSTAATSLPFWFRIEIPFWFLTCVSMATVYFSRRLKPLDYEKQEPLEEEVQVTSS